VSHIRLGVNIDHIATLRNARGGVHPDPVRGALMAQNSGADGITIHLREDRRHIRDADVEAIKNAITIPLNLEMAATDEMVDIACKTLPNAACIVPEKREEVTTEGGLDVVGQAASLRPMIDRLKEKSIRVSLFIDPELEQIEAASEVGAQIVEFHTGPYAHAKDSDAELEKMRIAVQCAHGLGLECHAGHGLTYDNVQAIAAIESIVELNIGHFLMGEAVFVGLETAIKAMQKLINSAR
jgi:pyridoxine 5-phosphate synthase